MSSFRPLLTGGFFIHRYVAFLFDICDNGSMETLTKTIIESIDSLNSDGRAILISHFNEGNVVALLVVKSGQLEEIKNKILLQMIGLDLKTAEDLLSMPKGEVEQLKKILRLRTIKKEAEDLEKEIGEFKK